VSGASRVESVVEALLASPLARGVRPDLAVHPEDEMLDFALAARAGERDSALAEYLWNGRWVANTIEQLADARFGGFERVGRMLDFACGYGRVGRWLAPALGPQRLTVSDILPAAVAFQRERFGVAGFVSTADPDALPDPGRFDLVWATSLFTHLPEPLFRRWLARLAALLAPGGLLAFSVLDMRLSPESRDVGGRGHRFEPVSESRVLDGASYGTAWVTPGFVDAVVPTLPGALVAQRIPRGLCDYQDLVLVGRAGEGPAVALPFDRGPIGFVERARVEGGARLVVAGWAVDASGGPVAAVELALAGEPAAATSALAPRRAGDLAGIAAPGVATDWRLELELPPSPAGCPAILSVRSASGATKPLFLGTLAELLRAAVERERDGWRERAERAEARQELYSASRFGRAHRAWLSWKRRLGRLPADFPEELLRAPERRE